MLFNQEYEIVFWNKYKEEKETLQLCQEFENLLCIIISF